MLPTELAVRSSDVVDGLDRQMVKVVGLEGEGYTLSIDGKAVGDFTKAQLAEGVNLATLATPMAEQASNVHQLTVRRAEAHNHRWRISRCLPGVWQDRRLRQGPRRASTPSKARSRSNNEPPPSPSRTSSS